MNKTEYLSELEKALKAEKVQDYKEILGEYDEHFNMKLRDGYSEDEISARLAAPREIAAQYGDISAGKMSKSGGVRLAAAIGLVLADIFMCMFMALFFAALIISPSLCAITFAVGGILSAAQISLSYAAVPFAPYPGALFVGIALIALGVISAAAAVYGRYWFMSLTSAYIRWHKNTLPPKGQSHLLPPLPKFPVIGAKKRRVMRSVVLISVIIFIVTFAAGYLSLAISAGNVEFWHVWHWFE